MTVGRPLKYKTPKEMQSVIDMYFYACKINKLNIDLDEGEENPLLSDFTDKEKEIIGVIEDVVPTVCGLAYVLGMSRQALINYEDKDKFVDTVKRAKQRIEMSLEQRLAGHNVTGSIFNLKNNFGWKDKTEQELSGPNGGPVELRVGEALNFDDIRGAREK